MPPALPGSGFASSTSAGPPAKACRKWCAACAARSAPGAACHPSTPRSPCPPRPCAAPPYVHPTHIPLLPPLKVRPLAPTHLVDHAAPHPPLHSPRLPPRRLTIPSSIDTRDDRVPIAASAHSRTRGRILCAPCRAASPSESPLLSTPLNRSCAIRSLGVTFFTV